jgi:hypothetical protein
MNPILTVAVAVELHRADLADTARSLRARMTADERGEGVISAAIAVLIMAILGGAMYYAYRGIFDDSSNQVRKTVTDIGSQPIR